MKEVVEMEEEEEEVIGSSNLGGGYGFIERME